MKNRLLSQTLEDIQGMDRAARSRYLGPQTAGRRLAARHQHRDHLAERVHQKAARTPNHYKALLVCPNLVFKRYGEGLPQL